MNPIIGADMTPGRRIERGLSVRGIEIEGPIVRGTIVGRRMSDTRARRDGDIKGVYICKPSTSVAQMYASACITSILAINTSLPRLAGWTDATQMAEHACYMSYTIHWAEGLIKIAV